MGRITQALVLLFETKSNHRYFDTTGFQTINSSTTRVLLILYLIFYLILLLYLFYLRFSIRRQRRGEIGRNSALLHLFFLHELSTRTHQVINSPATVHVHTNVPTKFIHVVQRQRHAIREQQRCTKPRGRSCTYHIHIRFRSPGYRFTPKKAHRKKGSRFLPFTFHGVLPCSELTSQEIRESPTVEEPL